MNVSVIVPAFEEEQSIADLVQALRRVPQVHEVIVVDDGSSDATAARAEQAGARVVRHPYNKGNGASIKTGIREASGDVVAMLDADGQHHPGDLPRLLEHLKTHDMVVGARTAAGQASIARRGANVFYNALASYVTRFPVQDLTSGFRALKTAIARRYLYLLPNTFSYPSTLTLALLRSGHSVHYVPIEVHRRQGNRSKIRLFEDGLRFCMIILKVTMLFSPLRVFAPVSFFFAALGLSNYAFSFAKYHRFTNMSALLLTTSVIVFMLGLVAEQIAMLRMERTEESGR